MNLTILMEDFDLGVCPGLSVPFLYAPTYRTCLFEKFIFELESFSYSFKTTCILLKQVISSKKMLMSSAKFTNLTSWSPLCTPLIPLSAPMKLASTSVSKIRITNERGHP